MVWWVLLLPVLLHLIWYLVQWLAIRSLTKSDHEPKSELPVSLIIAARNEAENLLITVPEWLKQAHPNFEVVIVNDRSLDDTFDVIRAFEQNDARVSSVEIRENQGTIEYGKKYALTLGIKAAKHENLVFTDADCLPSDTHFLSRFANGFEEGNTMILGFGGFQSESSFVNLLYRLENARVAINYFTSAWLGKPVMAVGRSFGYTKSLFLDLKGFLGHRHIASGDDDLFLHQARKKASIKLVPEATSISHAPSSLVDWLGQKKRHNSTSKYYPKSALMLLGLIEVLPILSWLVTLVLLVFSPNEAVMWTLLGLVLTRFLLFHLLLGKMLKLAQELSIPPFLFALEPLLCVWNSILSSITLIIQPVEWKRKI